MAACSCGRTSAVCSFDSLCFLSWLGFLGSLWSLSSLGSFDPLVILCLFYSQGSLGSTFFLKCLGALGSICSLGSLGPRYSLGSLCPPLGSLCCLSSLPFLVSLCSVSLAWLYLLSWRPGTGFEASTAPRVIFLHNPLCSYRQEISLSPPGRAGTGFDASTAPGSFFLIILCVPIGRKSP